MYSNELKIMGVCNRAFGISALAAIMKVPQPMMAKCQAFMKFGQCADVGDVMVSENEKAEPK